MNSTITLILRYSSSLLIPRFIKESINFEFKRPMEKSQNTNYSANKDIQLEAQVLEYDKQLLNKSLMH